MIQISRSLGPNEAKAEMPTNKYHMKNIIRMYPLIHSQESEDPAKVMYVLDLDTSEEFSSKSFMKERSMCLTRSRCGNMGYWLSAWQRRMMLTDMRKLQGFPVIRRPAGVTERHVRLMLGNAMCVPVLARVLRMVLGAAKLIDLNEVEDPVLKRLG